MFQWHREMELENHTDCLMYSEDHLSDQQHVLPIHRWSLYTGSITWKVYTGGPTKCGLYKEVVFIYRWSLEQVSVYLQLCLALLVGMERQSIVSLSVPWDIDVIQTCHTGTCIQLVWSDHLLANSEPVVSEKRYCTEILYAALAVWQLHVAAMRKDHTLAYATGTVGSAFWDSVKHPQLLVSVRCLTWLM